MKAREKRGLVMLNTKAFENFHVSNSQKFRFFVHERHEKISLSNSVRIKCITKQFIFLFLNEYNQQSV